MDMDLDLNEPQIKGCMGCMGVLFLGGLFVSSFGLSYCTQDTKTFKVVDKYVKTEGQGRGVFYVVGEDKSGNKEVFENTDTIAFFKFDSADLQQKISLGNTYKMDVNWMRIPFLSMYRNVLDVELVSTENNSTTGGYEKASGLSKPMSLEGRYVKVLLDMLNENQNIDVAKLIEAHTALEATKDPQNATKIKAIGNKYYTRYMESSSLEAFKEMLYSVVQGQSVAKRIQSHDRFMSFKLQKQALQQVKA
ncbi:MAG: DUF1523 family protein [Alphaproteobacteria bacterium]|nr:DUF1523 family protein [Alphaproteobacteria bacterium]